MVDNNCIIEGNVKFRDGKKWKSRWCVMRKLSPVADCLHLQLYADSKDRYKQCQTKASLSLQHFLGVESGFTLDKESNTIAIICQDVTVVLAFDTRERLIQWQVKISNNLGEDQQYLILITSAPSKAKLLSGPAHLHVQDYRFCITVGVPPRLAGIWEIVHLRRYGVIEGRFCFEGGSRCGRGEGLHVLITDQAQEILKTIQFAAEGRLLSKKRPLTVVRETMDEDRCDGCKDDTGWSSTESQEPPIEWRGSLLRKQPQRCSSCISKLGTISKSSTVVTTATTTSGINSPVPNLTNRAFDRLSLSSYSSSSHDSDYSSSQQQSECRCLPPRPPKPTNSTKPPMPLPIVGTYENYDVPKSVHQYYDTPRKIKECLKIYPNYDIPHQTPQAVVLQQCGCPAKILTSPRNSTGACPCHNVMSWAGFVLPYCRRGAGIEQTGITIQPIKLSGEGKMPVVNARGDVTIYKKTNTTDDCRCTTNNYENLPVIDTQPESKTTHNYVNLDIAVDVVSENVDDVCEKCGHVKETEEKQSDEYLTVDLDKERSIEKKNSGYLHMQPLVLSRICAGIKSCSNPQLSTGTPSEGNKKRSDSEYRIPGSAMLSSPYLRRRFVDTNFESGNIDILLRKRSYSAESARYLDEDINTVRKKEEQSNEFIKIRRSSSVPTKNPHANRDSSSSNDSGVSIGSLSQRTSLTRKSKSSELSFQFQKIQLPIKSTSTDANIPTNCVPKISNKVYNGSPGDGSTTNVPYIDSRSTSSGTSDMSDYIETLSLSSHSSSDTPDSLRLGGRTVTTTLRPRSGKEYYKIDRSSLVEQQNRNNYANITPVLENHESPSPGYVSGSPQPARQHFLFPEEA